MEERCRELFNDLIYYYPEIIPELMKYLMRLTQECDNAFMSEQDDYY